MDSPIDQIASLTTFMVSKIWEGYMPSLHQRVNEFHAFVKKVIRSTAPNVTATVVILALYYVSKLKMVTRHLPLHFGERCEFRIWLTALMLADSFMNDNSYTCKSWSQVSGFTTKECATMKREFLEAIHYSLNVSNSQYMQWIRLLKSYPLASKTYPSNYSLSAIKSYPMNSKSFSIPSPPLSTASLDSIYEDHHGQRI